MTARISHSAKPFAHAAQLACATALALGLSLAVGAQPAHADAARDAQWNRLYGQDAYGTMAQIAQAGWQQSDVVVIATFDGYWDALAASALAGANDAPVLLTGTDALNATTKSEIARLGATKAYICGGNMAVSASVEKELAALGLDVERLAGAVASDTAIEISQAVPAESRSTTCIVATDGGYWDALAASPYAYAKGAPIFLTNGEGTSIGKTTLTAIETGGYTRIVVAGGPAAVSDSVAAQLEGLGTASVKRVYGQTAYDTAIELAKFAHGEGLSYDNLGVATADGYWDALTGAAYCGSNGSVLILADDRQYAAARSFASDNKAEIDAAWVFGGPAAMGDKAFGQLQLFTKAGATPEPGAVERANLDLTVSYRDGLRHGPKGAAYQKYIVLHDTEGGGTPMGVVEGWDYQGTGVAAHFVVGKDGSIAQCVPLDEIAHHAGFGDTGHNAAFGTVDESRDDKRGTQPIGSWAADYGMNSYSIGIEMVHVGGAEGYTEAQLEALDDLIAYIDAYYGFESIITDHKAWRSYNPDTSAEFAGYFANYQDHRTHD